jgi:hypothetical protein
VPKLGHYLMIVLRSSNPAPLMSALPPKADIAERDYDVR